MVGIISAYNSLQKITEIPLSGTMTDATPIYTCPAGKKAMVNYFFYVISYGASGTVWVVVNGTNQEQWTLADEPATNTALYRRRIGSFLLGAGQEFHGHGSVADNETINYFVNILELPAA